MKRLLITLLLVASSALGATWKAEGPYFGNVLSIAVDAANPNRLWISTHGGGVWRSTDGGTTWKLSGKELSDRVVAYVVQQPKSNTLWAGVERSTLARSKDGGDTWEWITNGLTYTPYVPAFDANDPKAIWIPSSSLHQRSKNAGGEWIEFRVGNGDVRAFAIHPANSKVIFAGGSNTRSGLWRSTDGGASFREVGKDLPESNLVSRLRIDPAKPDTMYMTTRRGGYKSVDGGESWTPFGGVVADEEIEGFALHPTAPDTLFAGTKKGFHKSTDGGDSWTRISGGLPRYVISAIAFHPQSPDTMWVGASSAGVFKTTDGGKTWVESNGGFAAAWIDDVWADPSGTMFTETRSTLWRNDGKGWKDVGRKLDEMVFQGNTIHGSTGSSYYRSTDGGVTWTDIVKSFQEPSPAFYSIVADAKNPRVLYSADARTSDAEPAIFKSTDGGVLWKPSGRGITGKGVFALRADGGGTLYALGSDGVLWRSADSAATWSAVGPAIKTEDLKSFVIDPTNASRMYVGTKETLLRSEDGGATFIDTKLDPAAVAVDGKGNVYLATDKGVSRSSDGGKTWTAINDGLTNIDVRSLYVSGNRLYAGSAGGGVFSMELQ
jgi:photosystem II stability/assembly factor-like uncharacterized protein